MNAESLLVSVSINIGLALLILALFSVLRKQPSNTAIYYARRLSQHHHVSFYRRFFPWRLLPSVEWVSSALRVTEAEILDSCGLDAFVFVRLFKFGWVSPLFFYSLDASFFALFNQNKLCSTCSFIFLVICFILWIIFLFSLAKKNWHMVVKTWVNLMLKFSHFMFAWFNTGLV